MVGYLVFFYLAWSIKELWLIEYIYAFGEILSPLLESLVKSFIWIVPVWIYVKFHLQSDPTSYLKMNINVMPGILWGILLSLLLGAGLILVEYISNGISFNLLLSFDDYLNTVIIAGLAEEIVFRGFILQEFNKKWTFWKANVVTASLFLVIHYPIWIYNGTFLPFDSHIYVFFVGILFGFIFKKTGSLWTVIILHAFHNYVLSIF